jgi:hypothetical protein
VATTRADYHPNFMSDPNLQALVEALARLVRTRLAESAEVRDVARCLGTWLLDEVQRASSDIDRPRAEPEAAQPAPLDEAPAQREATTTESAPPTEEPAPPQPTTTIPLRLGDAALQIAVPGATVPNPAPQIVRPNREDWTAFAERARPLDLALIERRSRLKADGAAHALRQPPTFASSGERDAWRWRMDELIWEAKSLDSCFLWMFYRPWPRVPDEILRSVEAAYRAHAEAARLVLRLDEMEEHRSEGIREAFLMLAEANSALRVALFDTPLPGEDDDQRQAHFWLRQETASRSIYVGRHMSVDDPADPERCPALLEQIAEQHRRLDTRSEHEKEERRLLSKLKYHGKLLVQNEDDRDEQAGRIEVLLDEAWRRPMRQRTSRIEEALGPEACALLAARGLLADRAPSAGGERAVEGGGEQRRAWSESVERARSVLRGTAIVVVGGERYPDAMERMREAFEVSEVLWTELREHASSLPLRAPIARPETSVVFVIIKLAGHAHTEDARRYAAAAGKPCVLLTGGYNPEAMAHAMLEQTSIVPAR